MISDTPNPTFESVDHRRHQVDFLARDLVQVVRGCLVEHLVDGVLQTFELAYRGSNGSWKQTTQKPTLWVDNNGDGTLDKELKMKKVR